MLPVAILAGGRGTRMAEVTGPALPKAMLPVAGRPFIDVKLAELARQGVELVVLLVGHGAEAIADHVGDGSAFGLRVRLVPDGETLLGTGGAILRALPELGSAFWVTFGDNLLAVPLGDAEQAFAAGGHLGMMTVLRNCDRWDVSNVSIAEGLVTDYRKGAPLGTYEFIDYGMSILTPPALRSFQTIERFDLSAVMRGLIARRELQAFEVYERFYEIGSKYGYEETDRLLRARALAESEE
ncbi:MAG TPA: NTP transferase domain-containing protein [Actinomycetota bacterium]|nr:NTP transferase domain-containing protein [Actinomycetota bacterium]